MPTQSNLVDHARRELALVESDQEFIECIVNAVRAFAEYGHSGGSASAGIPMLNELLQFHNLAPLTDDPNEWQHHGEDVWGGDGGIWQSRRNPEAFSTDGGRTYYLLSEGANMSNPTPVHISNSS